MGNTGGSAIVIGGVWTGEEFLAWGHDRWSEGPTTVWASPDGKAWTERAKISPPEPGLVMQIIPAGDRLVAVGYEGGQFPLTPRAWTSVDRGRSWQLAHVPPGDAAMYSIHVEGSALIAHGNTSPASDQQIVSWRSGDGTTWTRLPDDEAMPALPGFRALTTARLGDRVCAAGTFRDETSSRAAIYCRSTVSD